MIKPKPRKCRACKKPFLGRNSFQICCSPACAVAVAKNAPEEARKVEGRMAKQWVKEKKEELKTHGQWENTLQDEINKIVRLIDKGHVCISCQREPKKKNAGHYTSVGSNNTIRFHLENIWLQDEYCNGYQSSNRGGYDEGLIATFGAKYHERVKYDIVRENPSVKLSIPELKEKIAIARQIVRELEKLDMTYPTDMRIALRRSYNERIGIYAA